MAKTLAFTETVGLRIEAIKFEDGAKRISLRQLYKTKKKPDEWQVGHQGLTLPFEHAFRIAEIVQDMANDPKLKFKKILPKSKD